MLPQEQSRDNVLVCSERSLHTAAVIAPSAYRPLILYCSLYNKKKQQFPKFPAVRSLARGEPKMADGVHFDRRLPRVPCNCSKPIPQHNYTLRALNLM